MGKATGGDEGDTMCIVTAGQARPFCSVCKVAIVDSPKAIKQHLKSKPHKDALKNSSAGHEDSSGEAVSGRKKGRKGVRDAYRSSEEEGNEEGASCEDEPCEVCLRVGRKNTRHSMAR